MYLITYTFVTFMLVYKSKLVPWLKMLENTSQTHNVHILLYLCICPLWICYSAEACEDVHICLNHHTVKHRDKTMGLKFSLC